MRLGRRQFIAALGAASASVSLAQPAKAPRYIFLMIGDGMGVHQMDVADRYVRYMLGGKAGLRMNRLPVKGFTTTDDVNGKTTDSAAAGTALACGVKTCNRTLGMLPDLKTPLRSIAKDAIQSGRKVGIITDVPVDHATPAAFYASVSDRNMYYEIDEFLASSGIDYIAGEPMLGRKQQGDRMPAVQLVKQAGYRMVGDRNAFDALKPGDGKVLVENAVRYNIEGRPEISLEDFTRKGIELLDNEKGFFIMVEGGKIDWCGHANDLLSNIHETLSFDRAVGAVLDFCGRHPDESLLIVTADHETGGLFAVGNQFSERFKACAQAQKFQSGHYAKQVESWQKTGKVSAEEAYPRLVHDFGLSDLSAEEQQAIRAGIDAILDVPAEGAGAEALKKMYGRKNPAVLACLHQVAKTANTRWTSFNHTSAPVKTSAFGVGAERFKGHTDNADIGKRLRELILD